MFTDFRIMSGRRCCLNIKKNIYFSYSTFACFLFVFTLSGELQFYISTRIKVEITTSEGLGGHI